MESVVFGLQSIDDFGADSLAMVVGVDQEMGEVDDEVTVCECVPETHKSVAIPGSDDGRGVGDAFAKLIGYVGGSPVVGDV